MAKILLGVTGSVAAIKTPELVAALRALGHTVKVVATDSALYFFDPVTLDPSRVLRNPDVVIVDDDEWPGRPDGRRYSRGDTVMHVELRRWADLLLVAPLDANTLAKLATGICDNCLTCVWRAWDPARPTIVAPAMNTFMWEHPLTRRQLRALAADAGAAHIPSHLDDAATIAQINSRGTSFRVVSPQIKALACGDVGIGAMADVSELVNAVTELLAPLGPVA
ncbi:MAG TPA: flavoprotein [Gemmataceae bacterium]|jgi:phosphopantothenoylcysteine decarboxylase|nr:flavoprotein [Gemmataceae bacterium]